MASMKPSAAGASTVDGAPSRLALVTYDDKFDYRPDDPKGVQEWSERFAQQEQDFVLAAMHRELEAHMRREEEEIFPALRRGLTPEEDARLTQQVNLEGRRFA